LGRSLSGKQIVEVIEMACKEETTEKIVEATDELNSYNKLNSKKYADKYTHVTVNHKVGQYDAGNGVHTNKRHRKLLECCEKWHKRGVSSYFVEIFTKICG
jgi:hypothetical protein